ncbi:MAG: 50S ribosomal protein L11 methyltransferase [Clostridiales bacterium]|nr:50S ribosomal protein L11 methyltransferase [Clostridiales bacterium]
MEYVQVTVYTNTAGIEPLTLALSNIGINGCAIEDAADFDEFLKEVTPHWDYVDEELMKKMQNAESNVRVFLPKNAQGAEQLAGLRGIAKSLAQEGVYGRMAVELEDVRDEDWASAWKQYFKPIEVGKKFLIKPSWEPCPQTERYVLEMDPGNAFGSGTHETTQLCVTLLEDVVEKGARVLDMGCGSGILATAALLCGAGDVTAVDIDEAAVKTAGENLERNGFTAYRTFCGNVLADGALAEKIGDGYDVILANIVADVIIGMAPLFVRQLKTDGTLIVSGIIGTRALEVRAALEETGFAVVREERRNDWVAYAMKRA